MTSSASHERIAELFREACRLHGPDRNEFLRSACLNADERAAVDILLAADGANESPVDPPSGFRDAAIRAISPSPDADSPAYRNAADTDSVHPQAIGNYRIMSLLGEGGMGTVFLAEQIEPIQRQVALKVIKSGMDTAAVVARFDNERQALAMMDHPSVARVLDAGSTPEGRPYFVMEYVDGLPITEFCDRDQLTVQERLKLFMTACSAVHHAHLKTIIHRDLKPSNVLVTKQNGSAAVKIIDFGIAKATQASATQQTMQTGHGQIVGTPAYMSPEQAGANNHDIDTRTDVYSLGVLLYELLVGTLPFQDSMKPHLDIAELRRRSEASAPQKLSTQLQRMEDSSVEVAGNRQTTPAALVRQLRGDLDWITMKALEHDRSRRYASASEFAEDIGRHLRAEPVSASPPSTTYRLQKFIHRHRAMVAAGIIVFVTMLAGLAGISMQYYKAERARADEQAQRRLAQANETLARERAHELDLVTQFQQRMLGEMNAKATGRSMIRSLRELGELGLTRAGRSGTEIDDILGGFDEFVGGVNATTLALGFLDEQILAPALSVIMKEFADNPLTRAALQRSIASTYRDFGLYDKALPLLESARETRERELGVDHPLYLESLNELGLLHTAMGQYDPAERCFRDALGARRRLLGDEHVDTLTSISNLGYLLSESRRPDLAEPYYREALEGRRRVLGDDHTDTLASINNVGSLLMDMGRLADAEPYYREASEKLRRIRGTEDPDTLTSINNLGALLRAMDKLEEAEPLYREALDLRRQTLGDEHPHTLVSLNNMGFLLKSMDRLEEAERFYSDALEIRRRVLGNKHPQTLTSLLNIGSLMFAMGRYSEAEIFYREALDTSRTVLGEDHPDTLDCRAGFGALQRACGQIENAEANLSRSLEGYRGSLGLEHPRTLRCVSWIASLRSDLGHFEDSEKLHREAVNGLRRSVGPEHRLTLDASEGLIECLALMGRLDEAESHAREVLAARHRAYGEAHSSSLRSSILLARVLVLDGRAAEAEQIARANIETATVRFGDRHWLVGSLLGVDGFALTRLDRFEPAEAALLKGYEILVSRSGRRHPDSARIAGLIVELYEAWDAAEPGKGYGRKADEWQADR